LSFLNHGYIMMPGKIQCIRPKTNLPVIEEIESCETIILMTGNGQPPHFPPHSGIPGVV